MTKLTLVRVNHEFFPYNQKDFDLLLKNNVVVFRIPSASLPLLLKTSLKGVKVEYLNKVSVLQKVRMTLETSLKKAEFSFKSEDPEKIVIKYLRSRVDEVEGLLKSYSTYLTRYGYKTSNTYKVGETFTMVRLALVRDPSLDPSKGFSLRPSSATPIAIAPTLINFSPVARMALRVEDAPAALGSSKVFSVAFEDKLSDTWVEAFRRSFDLTKVKREEVQAFTAGLVNLMGVAS
jgi:hypothetical protein